MAAAVAKDPAVRVRARFTSRHPCAEPRAARLHPPFAHPSSLKNSHPTGDHPSPRPLRVGDSRKKRTSATKKDADVAHVSVRALVTPATRAYTQRSIRRTH